MSWPLPGAPCQGIPPKRDERSPVLALIAHILAVMRSSRTQVVGILPALVFAFIATADTGGAAPSLRDELAEAVRAPDRTAQLRVIYKVLAARPNDDLPAAIARLEELRPDVLVVGEAVGYWFERDPAAARIWMGEHLGKTSAYRDPIFVAWSRTDPAGMIEWLNGSGRAAQYTHSARQALFYGLAQEDPAAAAELSLRFPNPGPSQVSSERDFFAEWARHEPSAAAARVMTLPTNDVKLSVLTGVVSGWCDIDPAAARRWVESFDDPALRRAANEVFAVREKVFATHAELLKEEEPSPASAPTHDANVPALSAALNHVSDLHIIADFHAVLDQLGPEATARGLEAARLEGQARVFTVLRYAYGSWAQKNLEDFRAHTEQMTDREARAIARIILVQRWSHQDSAAARKWAEALPVADRDSLLRSIEASTPRSPVADPRKVIERALSIPGKSAEAMSALDAWAIKDPAAASGYALKMEAEKDKVMAVSTIATSWAAKDPSAALAWTLRLDRPLRSEAAHSLFDTWARKDIEAALSAARALPDKDLRSGAITTIADILLWHDTQRAMALLKEIPLEVSANSYYGWGRRDPQAAAPALLDRMVTTPDPKRFSRALMSAQFVLGTIVGNWIEKDSAAATAFVLEQPPWVRRPLYRSVVAQWAKSAPGAPAQWLIAQFEPGAQEWESAMEAAVSAWAERSEKELVAWLDGMPADDKRDAVTTAFAYFVIQYRPDEALARIRTIGGLKQQQDALYGAWMRWWPGHRDDAFRWLGTAKVSAEERELLIHGPKETTP